MVTGCVFHYFSLAVTEWGDDVRPISEEEAMVLVNHQSTGDVCTLMMCLQDKGTVRPCYTWLRAYQKVSLMDMMGELPHEFWVAFFAVLPAGGIVVCSITVKSVYEPTLEGIPS